MEKAGKQIKKREKANDVFYTPISLVNQHIDLVKDYIEPNKVIYEPFYGSGNYYNQFKERFPNNTLEYTEIELGTDFFQFDKPVDYIISNPPYSMIDKVLEKSCDLKPNIISYLFGFMNITTKRIEYMNKRGYYIQSLHLTKVFKWFGMSAIITFSNSIQSNCISFDRVVHR
jgi:type I restriction-modification system DNA methylase subunit